jgi:gliding motility-associated-like protein
MFALHIPVNAQVNLVPNGSFEEYDTCPNNYSQIDHAKYWHSPLQTTPDYFNSCASLYCSTPLNLAGYQIPKSGNGYSGIIIYSSGFPIEWMEYLQVKLIQKLVCGRKYKFSFSLSVAETESTYAVNLISAKLSDIPITSTDNIQPIITSPTFTYNEFMADTSNWIDLSWDYVAIGTEEYLTIGNFTSSVNIDTININTNGVEPVSYLFIDDVKLIEYPDSIAIPNVFTPNNDGFNDKLVMNLFNHKGQVNIYNRWGRTIFKQSGNYFIEWDGTSDGNQCDEGVYFYVLKLDNNNIFKGSIQLLR